MSIFEALSCIVLDFELGEKNVIRSWEFLLMGMFKNTHFVVRKSTYLQKKRFGLQRTCTEVYLALKLKFVKSRGYETYKPKEV